MKSKKPERPRFKVYISDGWMKCIALNQPARDLINGKKMALLPFDYFFRVKQLEVPY